MPPDPAIDSAGRLGQPDITRAVADAADRVTAVRVVTKMQREGRLSLSGRMAALTDRARDFQKKTESVLDALEEKINKADTKLNVAAEKHHAYYDGLIAATDESAEVVDRLSNGPLHEGGEG